MLVLVLIVAQLVFLSSPVEASHQVSGSGSETAEKVEEYTFDATDFPDGPIDPAGITFVGSKLLISDSEINEKDAYNGFNMWTVDTVPSEDGKGTTLPWSTEPTGLAYNPSGGHLYISDDVNDRVFDVVLGGDGFDNDDPRTFIDTNAIGIPDPEDVAWDPVSRQVFIASGNADGTLPRKVRAISPGADGKLGTTTGGLGDDVLGVLFDVSSKIKELEGLGYRAASDTLLLVDPTGETERIWEYTKKGQLVRAIGIGQTQVPSDVAVAANGTTLYLVDRGEDEDARDGRWFEYEAIFHNLAPFVTAGPDQTVGSSQGATLSGTSYDDGQGSIYGSPPFNPQVTWSKVSGPGTVTFANKSAAKTTATFSETGTYVLRLSSTDGDATTTDRVQITVTEGSGTDTFVDDDDSIFEADIEWLAGEGITRGCNPPVNDMFCPDDFVTRGQMAAFLVRAFGYTDDGGGDLFVDDDGSTFEGDIDRLGTAGVTRGCNPPVNDRYCPDEFVTRGQMAAFLHRAFGD